MKSIFRFGQPIGTALVIVAVVETIYSLFWLLLDFVSLEQTSEFNFLNVTSDSDFEFFSHLQWHFWIAFHFLLSCIFWVSVIFENRKPYFYTWLILSFLHNVMFMTVIISQTIIRPPDEASQATLVYIGVSFFIIWRLYFMSVVCQGLKRLRKKYDLSSDSVSDLDICLEPLGSGLCQTWEYYKDLPGVGAITILTVELLWNAANLFTRPFVMQIFGLGLLKMPLASLEEFGDFYMIEETVVRCGRIFLDILGICFLFREKLNAVRIWVVLYAFLLIVSNVAAGLMITHWCTVLLPDLTTIIYHGCILVADNIFRITVLYFSIKYAMVHVTQIAKL